MDNGANFHHPRRPLFNSKVGFRKHDQQRVITCKEFSQVIEPILHDTQNSFKVSKRRKLTKVLGDMLTLHGLRSWLAVENRGPRKGADVTAAAPRCEQSTQHDIEKYGSMDIYQQARACGAFADWFLQYCRECGPGLDSSVEF